MSALPFSSKVVRSFINNRSNLINYILYHQFPHFRLVPNKGQGTWPVLFTYRCMAGHAKWQNVAHIKSEKDRAKSILFNKYIRLISAAVRGKILNCRIYEDKCKLSYI